MEKKLAPAVKISANLVKIRIAKRKINQKIRGIKAEQKRRALKDELITARQIGQVILTAIKKEDPRIDKISLGAILDEKIKSVKARGHLKKFDIIDEI